MTPTLSDRAPVSERQLRYRLNRRLILQGQRLFKTRGSAFEAEAEFAVTDGSRIVQWLDRACFVELAREQGAVQPWEELA